MVEKKVSVIELQEALTGKAISYDVHMRFLTLKRLVSESRLQWWNHDARCFLCNNEFVLPETLQGQHRNLAYAISIEKYKDGTHDVIALHGTCFELVNKFFGAFFRDSLYYYFFQDGLESLVEEFKRNPIELIEMKD